jgi:hypothetical protein
LKFATTFIDFDNTEHQDFPCRDAGERNAMSLTFVMLALLIGCYAVCAALVLFAENVIRPRSVDGADLPQSSISPETGMQ